MKTLMEYIIESKSNSIVFRGSELSILKDTDKELTFEYEGKEYSISKKPILGDCPADKTWNGFPINVSVNWYDGHCKTFDNGTKDDDTDDADFKPNEKYTYPSIKEIFSNAELLEDALAYRIEHEDRGWYDGDIFNKLTLMDVVEGFFVCSGHFKKVK